MGPGADGTGGTQEDWGRGDRVSVVTPSAVRPRWPENMADVLAAPRDRGRGARLGVEASHTECSRAGVTSRCHVPGDHGVAGSSRGVCCVGGKRPVWRGGLPGGTVGASGWPGRGDAPVLCAMSSRTLGVHGAEETAGPHRRPQTTSGTPRGCSYRWQPAAIPPFGRLWVRLNQQRRSAPSEPGLRSATASREKRPRQHDSRPRGCTSRLSEVSSSG